MSHQVVERIARQVVADGTEFSSYAAGSQVTLYSFFGGRTAAQLRQSQLLQKEKTKLSVHINAYRNLSYKGSFNNYCYCFYNIDEMTCMLVTTIDFMKYKLHLFPFLELSIPVRPLITLDLQRKLLQPLRLRGQRW